MSVVQVVTPRRSAILGPISATSRAYEVMRRSRHPGKNAVQNTQDNMKSYAKVTNRRAPVRPRRQPSSQQPPELERRINAGWLRLWKSVYPNTPSPTTVPPPRSKVQRPADRRPAAVERLATFLSISLALALLATGCAAPRPLRGGKAVTTHKPVGVIEQTLVQGENPSQASKQTQESVKVRTYTLPVGSRIEQSQAPVAVAPQTASVPHDSQPSTLRSTATENGATLNPQPSSAFILSAPMSVVEREETHAATELGAAQHDTARELGAKLSSLKGIVWVGVGLFVFGLASLVYPPLKVIIGSVTTSAALMLGGVALMVLPSLVVGNELLILGGVGVAVGGWFLAHRHGQLRGIVAATAGTPGAGTGDQKS
jgi:hypothetical protein